MLSGLLNRLTRKSKEPVRKDYTPLVNQLLNELPRCTSKVVAISHAYGNSSFTCEIYVSSLDLLTQAEANEQGVWSSDDHEQAARLAFPIWLREADLADLPKTRKAWVGGVGGLISGFVPPAMSCGMKTKRFIFFLSGIVRLANRPFLHFKWMWAPTSAALPSTPPFVRAFARDSSGHFRSSTCFPPSPAIGLTYRARPANARLDH